MKEGKSKRLVLTREYLVRATYSYLQRFATTEKNLRDVLGRKVRRRLPESGEAESEWQDLNAVAVGWVDEIVQKAVQQNLVNDRQFAETRAVSLMRSGNSKMKISQKLLAKGVMSDIVADVVQALSEQCADMDFLSAVKYTRKRRFGAFSSRHNGDEVVEKELASMCRAGFSFTLARRILMMPHEELEEALYQTSLK